MKLVAAHLLASKQREADVIGATELEWVLVRPPHIVAGSPTGRPRVTLDPPASSSVTRGGVAAVMLRAARQDTWVRQAPFVAGP